MTTENQACTYMGSTRSFQTHPDELCPRSPSTHITKQSLGTARCSRPPPALLSSLTKATPPVNFNHSHQTPSRAGRFRTQTEGSEGGRQVKSGALVGPSPPGLHPHPAERDKGPAGPAWAGARESHQHRGQHLQTCKC